jgi:hypothetical protein
MRRFLNTEISWGSAGALYGLFLYIFSLIMMICSSCSTEKKALVKAQNKVINSGTLADLCAKFYPARVSKGDTIYRIDTAYSTRDTTIYKLLDGDTTFITLPQLVKTITISKTIHDTLIDEAKLKATDSKLQEALTRNEKLIQEKLSDQKEIDNAKHARNKSVGLLIGLVLLAGVFFYFKR